MQVQFTSHLAYANAFDLNFVGPLENFIKFPIYTSIYIGFILLNPKVQKLLKSDESFDVVITEIFQADALFGE